MNIALTGAHGFIGRILFDALVEAGHAVMPVRTDDMVGTAATFAEALIHCARHHDNIVPPITHEKALAECETVANAYEYTRWMAAGGNLRNVIVITSIYGRIVPDVRPIPWNYQLAKAAEQQMIRVLAQELAPSVRVNGVELGGVLSNRAQAAQDEPGFLEGYNAKTLLRRMVLPEEVPGAVLFLLSDAAAGMTVGIIPVNGGYGIT